jgi:hypothetical protein
MMLQAYLSQLRGFAGAGQLSEALVFAAKEGSCDKFCQAVTAAGDSDR